MNKLQPRKPYKTPLDEEGTPKAVDLEVLVGLACRASAPGVHSSRQDDLPDCREVEADLILNVSGRCHVFS